ncbi:MAG: DUF1232 domain-containing protein [Ornithinimicrobium sp.]
MDWSAWVSAVAGALAGLLVLWVGLLVALAIRRPDQVSIREALRMLPDLIRMLRGMATDPTLPRGVRIRLWVLLGYLLSPIDLVPDVIPVLGYADDAIIVALALRSVARRAGSGAFQRHWPGSPAGLAAVRALAGIPDP